LTVDRPTVVMLIVGTLLLGGAAVAYGRSLLVFPLILFGGLALLAALVLWLTSRWPR
jgi:hypothetical protein